MTEKCWVDNFYREPDFSIIVGQCLADARKARGLDVDQVARLMGTTVRRINQIESGAKNLTLCQAKQFADVVGCNLGALLNGPAHILVKSSELDARCMLYTFNEIRDILFEMFKEKYMAKPDGNQNK